MIRRWLSRPVVKAIEEAQRGIGFASWDAVDLAHRARLYTLRAGTDPDEIAEILVGPDSELGVVCLSTDTPDLRVPADLAVDLVDYMLSVFPDGGAS